MRRVKACEHMMDEFAFVGMILLAGPRAFCLFRFLIAAGVQVRYQIINFGCLQNVAERWHLAATLCDLTANLSFVQRATNSGQIRSSFAALVVDGVTVLATVTYEDGSSALLCSVGECGKTRCERQGKD